MPQREAALSRWSTNPQMPVMKTFMIDNALKGKSGRSLRIGARLANARLLGVREIHELFGDPPHASQEPEEIR
jgi:hypothetical protein